MVTSAVCRQPVSRDASNRVPYGNFAISKKRIFNFHDGLIYSVLDSLHDAIGNRYVELLDNFWESEFIIIIFFFWMKIRSQYAGHVAIGTLKRTLQPEGDIAEKAVCIV